MSEKEQARIEFHKRRELETNEHDFAFLDGFDAGAAQSAHRVAELAKALRDIKTEIETTIVHGEQKWQCIQKAHDIVLAALADGLRS